MFTLFVNDSSKLGTRNVADERNVYFIIVTQTDNLSSLYFINFFCTKITFGVFKHNL